MALALERSGRLERSRKELSEAEVIARIGRSLLELPSREALLQGVAESMREFRDYFDVSLFWVDQEAQECVLVAEAGRGKRYRPEQYRQKMGQGFIGICAESGETIRASDLEADSRRLVAFEEEYRARCELAVPVKSGQRVLGVMHFLSDREEPTTSTPVPIHLRRLVSRMASAAPRLTCTRTSSAYRSIPFRRPIFSTERFPSRSVSQQAECRLAMPRWMLKSPRLWPKTGEECMR